ncbi:MAG: hypothetical protein R2873_22805 [Caldilineaceae bacterium]
MDRALEASKICGKPLMVDFWPRPERTYPELILEKMQPGDIHTHVFAQQFPVLDDEGKPAKYMFEAQQRAASSILDMARAVSGSAWRSRRSRVALYRRRSAPICMCAMSTVWLWTC